jgi:hypothetical protein
VTTRRDTESASCSAAFADGWEVESVQPTRIEINPEFTEIKFSEGGPKAWLAVVRRKG